MGIIILLVLSYCGAFVAAGRLPCDFRDSVNITDGWSDGKGNIIHDDVFYSPQYYATIDYIYEIDDDNEIKAVKPYLRGCLCLLRSCVRICCLNNALCDDKSASLRTNSTSTSDPEHYEVIDIRENKMYGFMYGKPCEEMFALEVNVNPEDEWYFLRNASLYLPKMPAIYSKDSYCFYNKTDDDLLKALFCYEGFKEATKYKVYPVGMILSIPFLVATFFIYACIPELRNLHGKSLMCYVLGLAVGYTALSIAQLKEMNSQTPLCAALGFVVYTSFMVSFFWLNVMCFDIWWTFRGVRIKNTERKKFLIYSLYAWGCPLLMLSFVLIADFTLLLPPNARPQFGKQRCFITSDRLVEFCYLFLPIIILVFVNVTFFVTTALKIFTIQRETSVIRKGDSKRHSKSDSDKERFWLYLRLLIVMGVTWLMEIVSWASGDRDGYIFYLSDFCNCIQGFLIFMLFVWKQKVKRLIWKKLGINQGLPEQTTMTSSTRNTISSDNNVQINLPRPKTGELQALRGPK